MMHQQNRMEQYDDKLSHTKEQIMRKLEEKQDKVRAEKTNAMVDEAIIATKKVSETKQNNEIMSLKHEQQLSEKDALLSDYKRKIQESEAELEKRKESEANLFDTLVMQTKQLEQNKILLEESRLEIASLEEKLKKNQLGANKIKTLEEGMKVNEDGLPKNKLLDESQKGQYSMTAKTLVEELNLLKSELESATKAEENSKKAMDDLAFALKEVATEANQVKAKLTLSQVELEHTKDDAERWKVMLESTEEKYRELLDVTRKEADRYKNTAERLRLEAEESLLAWNGKETEFVTCIKRAEEERLLAQQETTKLLDLLKDAETKTNVSKEENQKLRDILKQALNEANVAKEAAEIAKAENARLQDSLSLLVHENEILKIHEAASLENIKELKRMLSESSSKEFRSEDLEKHSASKENVKAKGYHNSGDHKEHRESKSLSKTFSINLKDMITTHKQQHKSEELVINKETDDTLRGSIFDEVDSFSDSESKQDVDMGIPDDFDHLDESHFDDCEGDRNNRKRRALLRRFGDLIRRKSTNNNNSQRKEVSNEEHLQT